MWRAMGCESVSPSDRSVRCISGQARSAFADLRARHPSHLPSPRGYFHAHQPRTVRRDRGVHVARSRGPACRSLACGCRTECKTRCNECLGRRRGRAEEPASSQAQASHRHGPVPICRLARLVRLSSALVVGAAGLPCCQERQERQEPGVPGEPERRPRAASTRPRRGTQERVRGTTPHSGLAVIGTPAGPATALANPSVICCAKTTALHAATRQRAAHYATRDAIRRRSSLLRPSAGQGQAGLLAGRFAVRLAVRCRAGSHSAAARLRSDCAPRLQTHVCRRSAFMPVFLGAQPLGALGLRG